MSRAAYTRPVGRDVDREDPSEAALTGVVADAERSVLAAMLLGADGIKQARGLLTAADFYRTADGKVFDSILALADRGEAADSITVTAELARRGDLEVVGGAATIAHIFEYATTSANIEGNARIVGEAASKRLLLAHGRDLIERAQDPTQTAAAIRAHLEATAATLATHDGAAGARRFADAAVDAATFGTTTLAAPTPLLMYGDHALLSAGDGALMFGKAGIGKTALALGLAVATALGEPWLGVVTPKGGVPVGLLELELPADALQERLRVVAGDRLAALGKLHILCRPALKGLVDLDTEQDRAAMRAWVKAAGLRLVVIDALVRAHGEGEDDEGLKPLLLWLDALGRETGCAFLLLHHERKGDPQNNREADPLDAARGHSMLTTYPMVCMRVYRHGPVRALAFPKVTRAPEPPPVYFRIGAGGVPEPCEAPEAASRAKGEGNRTRVLVALRAVCTGQGGVPAEMLEAVARLSRSTVRDHLAALVKAGLVIRDGEGRSVTYRPSVQPSEQARSDASNGAGPQ